MPTVRPPVARSRGRFAAGSWRRAVVVAATVAAATTAAAARAGDAPPSGAAPDAARRAYVAAELYALASQFFGHREAVPTLDLEAALRRYLDEAFAAPDRRAFDLATMAFLAELHNGHSGFRDGGLGSPWSAPLGFHARPVGDAWVVTSSRVPALAPGDVVTHLDDRPMERFFEAQRRYLSASSERAARLKLFREALLFPLRFELTLGGGTRVAVDRVAQELAPVREARTEGRWLEPGRIGYLRVPGFDEPRLEAEALARLDELAGAKALVVDVRGNGGGNTPSRLIGKLMDREWRSASWTSPMSVGISAAYAEAVRTYPLPPEVAAELRGIASFAAPLVYWPGELNPAQEGAFRGAVFILADAGCFSACEDFVMPFKDTRRATIVGEATGGSTGQPFVKDLGDGMSVRVGLKRDRMPDGSPFEGVGILPDVEVTPTPRELRDGRDPALVRALALARKAR